jgi:hypothetical protein
VNGVSFTRFILPWVTALQETISTVAPACKHGVLQMDLLNGIVAATFLLLLTMVFESPRN